MHSTSEYKWRRNTSFTATLSAAPLKLERRDFLMNKPQEQRVPERISDGKILEA